MSYKTIVDEEGDSFRCHLVGGGCVEVLDFVSHCSTTALVEKIKKTEEMEL